MTLYRVLHYPHNLLKRKSTPVTAFTDELRDFLKHLIATAVEFEGGGIAAPQVGVIKRIFVADFTSVFNENHKYFEKKEGDYAVYDAAGNLLPTRFPLICINPEIIKKEQPIVTDWEGCLSMPHVTSHKIQRFHSIEIKAFDEYGKEFIVKTHHLYAAVNFQHEIDHLDGFLMIDRWNKKDYSVKDVIAEIQDYQDDPQTRKRMKKLNLEDATKLKDVLF